MALRIDPSKYTPEEKDNFVRIVMSEKEIEAVVRYLQAKHKRHPTMEEAIGLCFRVAMKKVIPAHMQPPKEEKPPLPSPKAGEDPTDE